MVRTTTVDVKRMMRYGRGRKTVSYRWYPKLELSSEDLGSR